MRGAAQHCKFLDLLLGVRLPSSKSWHRPVSGESDLCESCHHGKDHPSFATVEE